MDLRSRFKKNNWADAIKWSALLLIIIFLHQQNHLNSDEGVTLNGAWNLLNGRGLYSDFFEFVPPGSFYLIFGFWQIFGASYLTAKLVAIGAVFLSAIGLFQTTRLLTKNKTSAWLPVIIFILLSYPWPIINHNIFGLTLVIWSAYFFSRALEAGKPKNFLASGFLTGLAFLFIQQISLGLCLAQIAFLIFAYRRQAIRLAAYFLTGVFLPLVILLHWPIRLLYENLFLFPILHYPATNRAPLTYFFIFLLTLLIVVWRMHREKKSILFLLCLQFFLLFSVLARPDYFHLSVIIFPLFILLAVWGVKTQEKNPSDWLDRYVYPKILAIILLTVLIPCVWLLLIVPPFVSSPYPSIDYVKKNCHSPYLYAGPFMPQVYFTVRKMNASPYGILITNQQTEAQFLEAKNALAQHQPDCAVLNYAIVEKFHHNQNNPVDNYILENYHQTAQFGNTLIYQKN